MLMERGGVFFFVCAFTAKMKIAEEMKTLYGNKIPVSRYFVS